MDTALLASLLDEDALRAAPAAARDAAHALRRDGLPRPRDEAWKYTSLRALEQRRYVAGDAGAATRGVDAAAWVLAGLDGPRLVFVNGAFRADLSLLPVTAGLSITPEGGGAMDGLAFERLADGPFPASVVAGQARSDAFARLNAALAPAAAVVRVDAGVQVDAPVHLVHCGTPADAAVAWQGRLQVQLGAGARLRLVEHHLALGDAAHFGNVVGTWHLGAEARLDLVQVQDAHAAATLVRRDVFAVGARARLALHAMDLGAQLMRHDITVDLAGNGARFDARGVFALRARQHADTHLTVRHAARDTACDIAWRGVADERSRGVFHGGITVAPGADGSDAQLSSRNLLLSPAAEIDTQPVLEIHADEVKAAHGATVGQLDDRALFYLRSRGIPLDLARQLLVAGFCRAMLEGIEPDALRAPLESLLATRVASADE